MGYLVLLLYGITLANGGWATKGRGNTFLVNYSAIRGDRYLQDFAAFRFKIIDEQSTEGEGSYVMSLNDSITLLKYISMCQLDPYEDMWDSLNSEERLFLHSYAPAALHISVRTGKVRLSWTNDRRYDFIYGYIIRVADDSLERGTVWQVTPPVTSAYLDSIPPDGSFLHLETIKDDKDTVWYSSIVKLELSNLPQYHIAIDSVFYAIGSSEETLGVRLLIDSTLSIDSVLLQVDVDHDKQFSQFNETFNAVTQDSCHYISIVIWPREPHYKRGRGFHFLVFHDGIVDTVPRIHLMSTNINNRIITNRHMDYLVNITFPAWRSFVSQKVDQSLGDPDYNGIFMDNVGRPWEWMIDVPGQIFDYDSSSWDNAAGDLIDTIFAITSSSYPLFLNTSLDYTHLVQQATGVMEEGWSVTYSGNIGFSEWRRQQDSAIEVIRNYGKKFLAYSNALSNDTCGRLFSYGSYLLIADSLTFYGNSSNSSIFGYFPEMDLDMGEPLDTALISIEELRDVRGCYIRHFERGIVIVNPTDESLIYEGPLPPYKVRITPGTTFEGSLLTTEIFDSNSVSLAAKTAAIFLNEPVSSPVIEAVSFDPPEPTGYSENRIMAKVFYTDSVWVEVSLDRFSGSPHLRLYDDGTHGDSIAGDSVFTASFTLPIGFYAHEDTIRVVAYCSNGLVSVKNIVLNPIAIDPSNILYNWSFEIDNDGNGIPDAWMPYGDGFEIDSSGENALSGSKAIKCKSTTGDSALGIYQVVYLNQVEPNNIVISGYSKAENVGEGEDKFYAINALVYCNDGSVMLDEYAAFPVGTHDWVYAKHIIQPSVPVQKIVIRALFKYHTGTVWFDNVGVYTVAPMPVEEEGQLKLDNLDFDFMVVPNPVKEEGIIRAYVPGTKTKVLKLYDCSGRLADLFELRPGLNEITWDTRHLPNGMYFLYSSEPRKVVKTLILR